MVNGLLIPPRFSMARLVSSPRFVLHASLLQQPGAQSPDFADQVRDILAFLAGGYRGADGQAAHAVPGERADAEVWILGSSGGESAQVAGANGLRYLSVHQRRGPLQIEPIGSGQ